MLVVLLKISHLDIRLNKTKRMNITMKNNTNIQYRQVGDFNIPNLILQPEEANITLGKWGMMYKDYLQKHNPILFATLLTQGKLYQHCAEVENHVRDMFDALIEQMKKAEGVTEQLKEENQLVWVRQMNSIQERATEIVNQSLIYT